MYQTLPIALGVEKELRLMVLVPSPTYITPPSGNTSNKQRRKKERQSGGITARDN
jgi:hypothetical protein